MKSKIILACTGFFLLMVLAFSVGLAQPDVTPPVDPSPPWWTAFAVFLMPVLNLLGKAMLMIPVVPNKLIPGFNAIIATIANYYGILGFNDVQEFGDFALAGTLGVFGAAILGMAQSACASWFYNWQRKKATKLGVWMEKGKRSLFNA